MVASTSVHFRVETVVKTLIVDWIVVLRLMYCYWLV